MEPCLSASVHLTADDQGLAVNGTSAQPLVLCSKEKIVLSKIIERMVSTLFSTRSNLDSLGRRVCIDTLGLDTCRWQESLPDSIRRNKWEAPEFALASQRGGIAVSIDHMLFGSARIALHCDQTNSNQGDDRARLVCISSAQEVVSIFRRYRSRFGLSHAPLIFIYGMVQAIRSLITFESTSESQYLIQALDKCCVTWGLAGQARKHTYQRMVA
ncbi:hypothetical protein EDB80DRAFT_883533 [Ilyonectria destructans]|nr:hypothetical protein EDB80DRAFT_883533 [Ilyonectria destructans]